MITSWLYDEPIILQAFLSLGEERVDLVCSVAADILRLGSEVVDKLHDTRAIKVAGDHCEIRNGAGVVTDAECQTDDAVHGRVRAQLGQKLFPVIQTDDYHGPLLM